jgi:HK97 family phage major capsid protein
MKHKTIIAMIFAFVLSAFAFASVGICGSEQLLSLGATVGVMAALPALVLIPALGSSMDDMVDARRSMIDQESHILDNPEEKRTEGEGDSQVVTMVLSEEQRTRLDVIEKDLRSIDKQIDVESRRESRAARQVELEKRTIPTPRGQVITPRYDPSLQGGLSRGQQDDIAQFSLGNLLRCLVDKSPINGIEGEMVQEGRKESELAGISRRGNSVMVSSLAFGVTPEQRDMTATGGTGLNQGGMTIATQKASILESLFPRSIFGQLGATVLTGLTGNLDIPRFVKDPNDPVGKAENGAASEISPTTAMLSLSPKRLPTFVDVSNQLFIQSQEGNLETLVRNHIEMVLRSVMQTQFINGAGTVGASGILGTAGIGAIFAGGAASDATNADGAAPLWADIVNLESALTGVDAAMDSAAYLFSTKMVGKLKQQPLSGGTVGDASRFIIPQNSGGIVNEHRFIGSTSVPSTIAKGSSGTVLSAAIFGSFVDYVIAQWSGMEFLVDEVTQATTGMTRIHAAVYYDGGVRRAESFAAGDDFVTT